MKQEIIFKKGIKFKVVPKTEYEKLPMLPGNYEVVFDHYFDGEKVCNNTYLRSDYMTLLSYRSEYEINEELKVFETDKLHKLLDGGYIHIVDKLF